MEKIIRGIVILMGIMLFFIFITACSSSNAFSKKDKTNRTNNITESDEYSFDYETDNNESKYRDSERVNNKKEQYSNNNINTPDNEHFYEKGYASWYGREFQGRKTASGDRFDMNKYTAAHRNLPFGTQVLVKNLENNNVVSVTINDRGPYKNARIIDLSYAAANKLGIIDSGEAMVGIQIIKTNKYEENSNEEDNNIVGVDYKENRDFTEEKYATDLDNSNYSIQAGAFYSRRNAEKLQRHLEGLIDNPIRVLNENSIYKVRIEKIITKYQVNKVKKLLESENIPSFIIENQE